MCGAVGGQLGHMCTLLDAEFWLQLAEGAALLSLLQLRLRSTGFWARMKTQAHHGTRVQATPHNVVCAVLHCSSAATRS